MVINYCDIDAFLHYYKYKIILSAFYTFFLRFFTEGLIMYFFINSSNYLISNKGKGVIRKKRITIMKLLMFHIMQKGFIF